MSSISPMEEELWSSSVCALLVTLDRIAIAVYRGPSSRMIGFLCKDSSTCTSVASQGRRSLYREESASYAWRHSSTRLRQFPITQSRFRFRDFAMQWSRNWASVFRRGLKQFRRAARKSAPATVLRLDMSHCCGRLAREIASRRSR